MRHPVTIVVPVYGDWPSLSDCIDSLKKNVDTHLHTVLLVNDCGPEANEIEKNIVIRRSTGREEKFDTNRLAKTSSRSGIPFPMAKDIANKTATTIVAMKMNLSLPLFV